MKARWHSNGEKQREKKPITSIEALLCDFRAGGSFRARAHYLRAPNYAIIQIAICVPQLFLVEDARARVCGVACWQTGFHVVQT